MADSDFIEPRRGMAIFAVMALVVIFTVLGVGAITLAQRDNASSGSTLDIKSRESAAYAGLVYSLGEFQRNPANFVALLESWRTRTVYGGGSPGPLYLKFSSSGGNVTLVMAPPAPFTPPGSTARVVVELGGIFVPSASSDLPVVVLKSTGTGRSGDAQTVIGVYQIQNVRYNTPAASLGISHPFYLNGKGTFNNLVNANGGDVYLGGNVQVNSATQLINVTNGGLHVKGNFSYNAGVALNVDSSSYVTGDFKVQGGGITFKKHLVIQGGLSFTAAGPMTVNGALVIQGAAGISDLNSGTLNVGSGVANSELYIPNGVVSTSNAGGNINVIGGSAYIHQLQLNNPNASGTQLSVPSGRLEWSDNPSLVQTFIGTSNSGWGHLAARSCKSGSSVLEKAAFSVTRKSWIETPATLALGNGALSFSSNIYDQSGVKPGNWNFPGPVNAGAAAGINRQVDGLTAEGFDAATPPFGLATLGVNIPANETEVGFDPTLDPTIASSAWAATGSALCQDAARQCGAGLNAAYSADVAAGSHHFYHGFFVVQLNSGMSFIWDASGTQTTPLVGKYLFLVQGGIAGTDIWPTTANNANPANPTNIEFIYVAPTGSIFSGFAPRSQNNGAPVTFCGYVRVNNPNSSATWNPATPLTIDGAFHITGANENLTVNSGAAATPFFTMNQAVLDVIGTAFATSFTDPLGNPLAGGGVSGFTATENWIQFRPIGELR